MFSGGTLTFLLLLYFMNACVAPALDSTGRGATRGWRRRGGGRGSEGEAAMDPVELPYHRSRRAYKPSGTFELIFEFFELFELFESRNEVSEASNGGESLCWGTSFLRWLCVLIALTWIPFPVWYALSPEGFNIIKDEPAMKLGVAFLNLFSKGTFIMYLTRVRSDHLMRQKIMVSVGYVDPHGMMKAKDGFDPLDGSQTCK